MRGRVALARQWVRGHPALAGIALASGVGCALSPAEPLPTGLLSSLLLVVVGGAVALAGSTAAWSTLGLSASVAVLVAGGGVPTVLAALAFGGACWSGAGRVQGDRSRLLHAGVASLVLGSLARSRLHTDAFFATSTVITLVVVTAVVVDGLRRAEPGTLTRVRRVARRCLVPVAVFVAVAGAGLALAAATAASDLRAGKQSAHRALAALDHGDFAAAADYFDQAHRHFAAADARLGRPWAWPAQAVPLLAHQGDALWELAGEATSASATISTTVANLDPDSVRVVDGQVDLASIAELAAPFGRLAEQLDSVRAVTAHADSGWLLPPLAEEVRDLGADLERNGRLLDNARSFIDLAPAMLGGDGERTYLVLFTTPAEARGLGGFPGNFAELTVDRGRVAMTRFGNWRDLESAIDPATFHVEGPEGFIDRYGSFGYELSADGRLKGSPWRNVTMPPDFPTVAEVAAEMYPQSGGRHVDGVLLADVEVLARLLRFTGPVKVDGWKDPITARTAERVLLVDQYSLGPGPARADFLSDVAHAVIDRLLAGSLPGTVELARVLGPAVGEGRLLLWSDDPDEQQLLRATRLLGEFPGSPLFGGADGFAVAITNVAGNKMDTFLERSFDYVTDHGDGGAVAATLRVSLTNSVQVDRVPDYVVSNAMPLPKGTNRARVCVTSPLGLVSAHVEGDSEVPWERIEEFGGTSYCRSVTLPPGEQVSLVLRLEGVVAHGDRPVVVWRQPLVRDAEVTVAAS